MAVSPTRLPMLLVLVLAALLADHDGAPDAAAQSVQDWPTYHHDFTRTGRDATQSMTVSVTADWALSDLDGPLYAEPLIVGNMVFLATEADTVYGVDAGSGSLIWNSHLGEPVAATELPCGDVDPVGITGTPVVDATTGTLYVVALIRDPVRHVLVSLSTTDGSIRWARPVDPPGADPTVTNERGALALSGGRVFVPFGGRAGDCGNYHGAVVGVNEDGSGNPVTYQVPTDRMGGIWAPAGLSVDSVSNVYVTTGNAASTTTFDYGNAVLKFTPTLDLLSFFAPADWADLSAQDKDLGSLAPTLLSDTLMFQIGKEGVGYLLRTPDLGGIGNGAFSAIVCDPTLTSGAFGAAAYAPPYLFVPCSEGMVALLVDPAAPAFSVAWRGPQFSPGPPILSGGLVWTMDRGAAILHALDPSTGNDVFDADSGIPQNHFASLASANSRLILGLDGGVVTFLLNNGRSSTAGRAAASPQPCPDVRLPRPTPKNLRPPPGRTGQPVPPPRRTIGSGKSVPITPHCVLARH